MLAHERTQARPQRGGRRPATAMLLAAAALFAAACSAGTGGQAGPGSSPVASLPGHGGGSAGMPPLTTASSDRDMISFTRCMRGHGVQMPDPFHRPGHSGLSMEMPPQDAATHAAWAACTHYIRQIIQTKDAHSAAVAAPQLPALTRYARCMRGHDIPMLDPTAQGELNLGRIPGMSSDFGRYSPQFRAADAACRRLLPAGVHDDGTGP